MLQSTRSDLQFPQGDRPPHNQCLVKAWVSPAKVASAIDFTSLRGHSARDGESARSFPEATLVELPPPECSAATQNIPWRLQKLPWIKSRPWICLPILPVSRCGTRTRPRRILK